MSKQRLGTRLITAHGRTQTINDWANELDVEANTLRTRLCAGLTPDEAMTSGRYNGNEWAFAEAWEGARDLPWAEDQRAQAEVHERGGMSIREVAQRLGMSSSRVDQIEKQACRKLAKSAGGRRLLELLAERRQARDAREESWPDW